MKLEIQNEEKEEDSEVRRKLWGGGSASDSRPHNEAELDVLKTKIAIRYLKNRWNKTLKRLTTKRTIPNWRP